MNLTNFQLSTSNATWVDVNPQYGMDNLPDRLPDELAISQCSLFSLFNCVPGQRARIFQPEYGSEWLQFIHEPIIDITAAKMQLYMIDAITRWEPRIQINKNLTYVVADTNIPGYAVSIGFIMPGFSNPQQIQFQVQL